MVKLKLVYKFGNSLILLRIGRNWHMANLLKRWVESDKRELKRLGKIADKVESYADEFGALSDDELKAKTEEFKKIHSQLSN